MEGGRPQVTLYRRAVGLRPPCHLAYRAQCPHSQFVLLLGIIPIGMFSLSLGSQYITTASLPAACDISLPFLSSTVLGIEHDGHALIQSSIPHHSSLH